ncbi:MAG: signal peptidase I [Solirubrobacterales bacterium]|nr:signal peptidase I [Solirubrobacterales bacterium]
MRAACLLAGISLALMVAGCGGSSSSHQSSDGRRGVIHFTIPNPGMEPTLNSGGRVSIREGRVTPRLGEIVAFHPPTTADPTKLVCGNIDQGPGQVDNQPCGVPARRESTMIFVERVVGLPGDHIAVVNGHAIRNGVKEKDAYIQPCPGVPECELSKSIVVPSGDYFLMEDNRGAANDSRFWGPLPGAWIIGTVKR